MEGINIFILIYILVLASVAGFELITKVPPTLHTPLMSGSNAISGITGVNIIGKISDEMCKNGIIDSKAYLTKSIEYLIDYKIVHLSISIECKIPKITPKIEEMKESIGALLNIENSAIGITATTGENLTEFGKGNGIQVFSIITAMKK